MENTDITENSGNVDTEQTTEPETADLGNKGKLKNIITKYVPKFSLCFFVLCVIAAIIHLTAILSEGFADFYNRNIGACVRAILSYMTSWLPFSLAETIMIGIPILLFIMIYISIKQFKKSDEASIRCIVGLFSVLTFLYSIFVLGFGTGYHGTSLSSKLKLEEKPVSAEELKFTAESILAEMTPLLDEIEYTKDGVSRMPYTLKEMNKKLNDTYKKANKEYTFIQDLRSNIKFIVLSEPMTYTHISGVYSYYTGEANLNVNFPDYSLPYTACHELAHQRGIAPENEANFVAFLVCMESDDAYIRYSGYLSMFEYVTNALYSASPESYYEVLRKTDKRIYLEMVESSKFFEKYRDSVASEVSEVVNDTYLKTQGQSKGSQSYGMVVDLAVAYYKQKQ